MVASLRKHCSVLTGQHLIADYRQNMNRSIFSPALAATAALVCAMALAACGGSAPQQNNTQIVPAAPTQSSAPKLSQYLIYNDNGNENADTAVFQADVPAQLITRYMDNYCDGNGWNVTYDASGAPGSNQGRLFANCQLN